MKVIYTIAKIKDFKTHINQSVFPHNIKGTSEHLCGLYLLAYLTSKHKTAENEELIYTPPVFDVPASLDKILKNEYGKPYFENGPYFSVSHSKDFVAVAVSDMPVGIDIQFCDRTINTSGVEKRFFTAAERLSTKDFFEIWTAKEAIVKKDGRGAAILKETDSSEYRKSSPIFFDILKNKEDIYALSIAY